MMIVYIESTRLPTPIEDDIRVMNNKRVVAKHMNIVNFSQLVQELSWRLSGKPEGVYKYSYRPSIV